LRSSTTPDIGADEGDFVPVVTGLTAPQVSISLVQEQLILSWEPVPNATFYKVLYSLTPDDWNYNTYHTTSANQYISVPGLSTFFFRVIACR
ncbi:MAG: hypothetical protein PHO32_02190, partial [Candidatus Cloacimonetes bacterium]|nr:hypothetical protein [Candidatus Cloacimonadota bacterium]